MIIARQSTARTVMIGPVLDANGVAVTDGVVADFEGSVNGGDPAALNGSATLTHRGVGFYSLALTATDLATVGSFEVTINDTVNACPMKEISVIEEAIYDAMFAASANAFTGAAGSTTLTALADGSITAAKIASDAITDAKVASDVTIASVTGAVGSVTGAVGSVTGAVGSVTTVSSGAISEASFATTAGSFIPTGIVDQGTAQSATGNDVVIRAASAFPNNNLVGKTLGVLGSTQGYWQTALITANVLSTDTVTILPPTGWVTPSGTITYKIFGSAPGEGVAQTGDAFAIVNSGIFGNAAIKTALDTAATNITTLLTRIPAALFTGITSLAQWLGLIAGKQTGDSTARTEVRATGAGSGTFDEITDSQEALRDRGDAAWVTGTTPPTAAAIADQVWEETLADHSGTSGSTAAALNAAGSAGDPWNTALPGSYGSGSAGKILGDNLNATVSSRASQTSVDDLPTNAELATSQAAADDATLAAIAALNNLSSAGAQSAAAAALAAYDGPTNAEMEARTLAAASYATAAALATVDTVVDAVLALLDDPRGEPGAGALPVNPDAITKLDYVYKLLRNKKANTGTENRFYADDGTTIDHTQTTTEAAGTVTKSEIGA